MNYTTYGSTWHITQHYPLLRASQSVHLRQSQTQILTDINIENSLVINILIIGLKIITSKIILVDGCLNLHEELLKH